MRCTFWNATLEVTAGSRDLDCKHTAMLDIACMQLLPMQLVSTENIICKHLPAQSREQACRNQGSRHTSENSPLNPMKSICVTSAPKLAGKCKSRVWTPLNLLTLPPTSRPYICQYTGQTSRTKLANDLVAAAFATQQKMHLFNLDPAARIISCSILYCATFP